MINQYIEAVETQKENEILKTQIEYLKAQNKDLQDKLEARESKIRDLEYENEELLNDDFTMDTIASLIEYIEDNNMMSEELKQLIEFYIKFYV